MPNKHLCVLMILDGWGINPGIEGNAVALAKTPFMDQLQKEYPCTSLACHGEAVGLPAGIMGNSEVGHLNIGAGRTVYQDLLRIDNAIEDGAFFKNERFTSLMSRVKERGSALHLMGLISDGGVHSQLTHLFALLDLARQQGIDRVYVHAILDGRDTSPDSGVRYVGQLQDYIDAKQFGTIATVCGRYYAMDRDTRWDRTEKSYQLYVQGEGITEKDPVEAVKNAYQRGETDEFVSPVVLNDTDDVPWGIIREGDGVIFFNFRADRARQIARALTDPGFDFFARKSFPELCGFVCMTVYDEKFTLPVAFPPIHLDGILGEIISKKGLRQLRIAETEKYAHVTYFFNGGEEKPFVLEDRHLIPSPREVPTYDLKPEMSAVEVTKETVSRIQSKKYDLIVMNFANGDMVGHTGFVDAAIKACETIDQSVREVVAAAKEQGGTILITSDHGNAEMMVDKNGSVCTAHTLNDVPFILVDDTRKRAVLRTGALGDIAPTILYIMEIEKPEQMTGMSLIGS